MAVRIVHASKDEYGRYSRGEAGDQNGQEVCQRDWYSRPWNVVCRPKYDFIASYTANIATVLAASPAIGYDQSERLTLYKACSMIDWDINRVWELQPCECDCSSFIAVVLRFAGIEIPENVWTGNLEYYLQQSGYYELKYDNNLLYYDQYIRAGDILLNRTHHVAIAITNGSKATMSVLYPAFVNVSTFLQVRTSPEIRQDNEFLRRLQHPASARYARRDLRGGRRLGQAAGYRRVGIFKIPDEVQDRWTIRHLWNCRRRTGSRHISP